MWDEFDYYVPIAHSKWGQWRLNPAQKVVFMKKMILIAILIVSASVIPVVAFSQTDAQPVVKQKANVDIELLSKATLLMAEALSMQAQGDFKQMEVKLQAAIEVYNQILQTSPDDIDSLNSRGLCKEILVKDSGKPDLERVIDLASEGIRVNPGDAKAFHSRAKAYRTLKQFDQARQDYQQAIKLYEPGPNEIIDLKKKWETDLRAMEIESRP